MKPFNVLYLHAHDAGRYIQPYGFALQTPALQKLAEEGMLFRQAFCANPTCSPSRACLLTGQYAHVNGMLTLAHRGGRLHHYEDTLIQFLGSQGWHTALAGQQHIAWEPYAHVSEIGYHEILTGDGCADDSTSPEGVAAAAGEFLSRQHDKPFFLDVGFFPPHRDGRGGFPFSGPIPDERYVRPPLPLPDNPQTRRDMAHYAASVATFDAMASRVLQALDKSGQAENTLVMATTDHGIAFPGMKCRLTDHGIGVMLILRGPSGLTGGKVSDAMVSQIDLFSTVCELLELPPPAHLQGKSLMPLVKEPGTEIHDEIFAEVNFHAAYEPMRAVRTPRWKYIRSFHSYGRPILPNCDDGPSKEYLHAEGWAKQPLPEEELYDLVFDPNECVNLAASPTHRKILREMKTRLEAWMLKTNDPLLAGALSAEGKKVTPREAYSPGSKPRVMSF